MSEESSPRPSRTSPYREETEQGALNDAGVIATLGAVAGHRPEDIRAAVGEADDGKNYEVRLYRVRYNVEARVWEPTGRTVTFTVTPDLPVRGDKPGMALFGGTGLHGRGGSPWCAVLEKVFAGIDQTWSQERKDQWRATWQVQSDPRHQNAAPPEGYFRLDLGTSLSDCAEILTHLTGLPASVHDVPASVRGCGGGMIPASAILADEFQELLGDNRPVLVSTRKLRVTEARLPHRLVASHTYEVVKIDAADHEVRLRNPWNNRHPDPLTLGQLLPSLHPHYTTLEG